MTGITKADGRKHFSFVLLPGFALTSFLLAIEALSVANLQSDRELYRYTICSPEATEPGCRIESSNFFGRHSH